MTTLPPQEIERKFLVSAPPALKGLESDVIRQGYVTQAGDSVELRLRQKGDSWFLTVKSDGDLSRTEYDMPISREQFDTLWPATLGRRVEKTRYSGRLADGALFELDIFSAALAPLMLVEVEFASVAEAGAFRPPAWFGPEVTMDRRYKNKALADQGRPAPPA